MLTFALGLNVKARLLQLGNSILANLVPKAFPFSRPTHFLREKPLGRGCILESSFDCFTAKPHCNSVALVS